MPGATTADHQPVTALEAPDAAAGAPVDIVNLLARTRLGATQRVFVVGISAIDDRVAGRQKSEQRRHRRVGDCAGGHHEPHRAGDRELGDERGNRIC